MQKIGLGFADDKVIASESPENLQMLMNFCEYWAKENQMLSRPGLALFEMVQQQKSRSVRRLVVVENMHAVVNGKHYRLCNCNLTIVTSRVLSWADQLEM